MRPALAWMAPVEAQRPAVDVVPWTAEPPPLEPGDVVVEAFGCDPPADFVGRMARRQPAPLWINLEYLSAEDDVERSHGLPSPQSAGPGAGLVKRFHYPGFTPRTGGLIRETGLAARQQRFDAAAWLGRLRLERTAGRYGERVVSLFCYANPALPGLLDWLAREPTLLLATAGLAAQQVQRQLGPLMRRGALRAVTLPPLSQIDYDHLLWACDLNFVRGEDSFVRAQWAGKPFVWQIYPQDDEVHLDKLDAYLDRLLDGAPLRFGGALRRLHHAWNGNAAWPQLGDMPDAARWHALVTGWRSSLTAQPDLTSGLLRLAGRAG